MLVKHGSALHAKLDFGLAKMSPATAAWSSDGTRIAFSVRTESDTELRWGNADGGGAAQRVASGYAIGWSNDAFFFQHLDKIWMQRPGEEAQALWNVGFDSSVSPDGEWVAFYNAAGNRNVAYIASVKDSAQRFQISKDGGHHPLWSRDGTKLYYAANSTGPATALMAVDVRTKPSVGFGEGVVIVKEMLQPLNIGRNYDITPDGRLVAAIRAPQRSTRSGEIIVVLNWAEELKRRVPIE